MLRETSAAPSFFESNGETCLYSVPMRARSSSSSTGKLAARGTWSSAYSDGERTSITSSKRSISRTPATSGNFTWPRFLADSPDHSTCAPP